jgi:hypothetical protein
MKMTEKEKGLIRLFKSLESEKCQDDLVFHAETMVRAQNALKADYGIVSPEYADHKPVPMGVLRKAVNA